MTERTPSVDEVRDAWHRHRTSSVPWAGPEADAENRAADV